MSKETTDAARDMLRSTASEMLDGFDEVIAYIGYNQGIALTLLSIAESLDALVEKES